MEPQEHLKMDVAKIFVEGSDVAMFNIWKALIPCMWMIGVVHAHDVHNHSVEKLFF
jgi:hypothetical protein